MRTNLGNLPITIDPVTGQAKVVRGSVQHAPAKRRALVVDAATQAHELAHGAARRDGPKLLTTALAPTFDSQLEADRAQFLFGLQLAGAVWQYVHHPFSVEIAPGCRYTPDFLVQWQDGLITIEEIKGSLKQKNARDSITRLKVAAAKLPMFRWLLITRVERQWIVRRSL